MIDRTLEVFHNRTLTLDGHRFVRCRFINAEIRYRGGPAFEFRDNMFGGFLNLEFDRRGAETDAMAAELDGAFRSAGFDLGIAGRIHRWRGPVFRFHTLLGDR
jgi:hypothetical protein